jgi:uncharacterized protein (TIGR03089 family)
MPRPLPAPRTFPAALAAQQRVDAGRPLVTFYDDATGERVELSVATYANWVAKTAGLAQDELDLERGGLVLADLPTHWLAAVWLGAAWTLGAAVTDDRGALPQADLVVCGPDRVEAYGGRAGAVPVVALSLRPLGGPFTEALPTGVTDFGAVVLAQPDVFTALDEPGGEDVAWRDAAGTATQADLLADAQEHPLAAPGERLLTDLCPCSRAGAAALLSPLLGGGGTVWVRNPDAAGWSARARQERATSLRR